MFRGINFILSIILVAGFAQTSYARKGEVDVINEVVRQSTQEPDYGNEVSMARDQNLAGAIMGMQAKKDAQARNLQMARALLGLGSGGSDGQGRNGSSGDRGFLFECRTSPNTTLQVGMVMQGISNWLNTAVSGIAAVETGITQRAFITDKFATDRTVSNHMMQTAITGNGNYIPLNADPSVAPWYVVKSDMAGAAMMAQMGYNPYMYGMGYGGFGYGTGMYGMGYGMGTGSYILNSSQMAAAAANRGAGATATTAGTTTTGTISPSGQGRTGL